MRVDNSRIRKEKVADSKISGYVWTGPQLSDWKSALMQRWRGLQKRLAFYTEANGSLSNDNKRLRSSKPDHENSCRQSSPSAGKRLRPYLIWFVSHWPRRRSQSFGPITRRNNNIPWHKILVFFLHISDSAINEAAKIIRLLHVTELRELQTRINEAIVAVQAITANPKTDQSLGRVGV